MTYAKHIERDGGLTFRMFLTGLFLVILWGILGAVLVAAGVGIGLIVIIEMAMIFGQYWFSDKIALFGMGGRVVTPEEEPRLHAMIDRLCALADMPKPRVAVAETDMPNAFATGRSPKAAVVCATRGIMRRLSDEELEAVLAHEISHVAHRDVAVMTIASSVGMLAGLLTRVAMWSSIFSSDRENQGGALAEVAIMLVSIVVYALSFLLTMALSRYRELAADRSGAILIGRPALLASALVKITGEMSRIPTKDLRKAEAFNAFFFTPAINGKSGSSLGNLFSTHPTIEKRLAQLDELERQINGG
ncbi:MAG: zinc metalloprotease HtpX [Actinomycetes bacterium]